MSRRAYRNPSGFTIVPQQGMNGTEYHIYHNGEPTGKYALTPEKAETIMRRLEAGEPHRNFSVGRKKSPIGMPPGREKYQTWLDLRKKAKSNPDNSDAFKKYREMMQAAGRGAYVSQNRPATFAEAETAEALAVLSSEIGIMFEKVPGREQYRGVTLIGSVPKKVVFVPGPRGYLAFGQGRYSNSDLGFSGSEVADALDTMVREEQEKFSAYRDLQSTRELNRKKYQTLLDLSKKAKSNTGGARLSPQTLQRLLRQKIAEGDPDSMYDYEGAQYEMLAEIIYDQRFGRGSFYRDLEKIHVEDSPESRHYDAGWKEASRLLRNKIVTL